MSSSNDHHAETTETEEEEVLETDDPILLRCASEPSVTKAAELAWKAAEGQEPGWTPDEWAFVATLYLDGAEELMAEGGRGTSESVLERGLSWCAAAAEAFSRAKRRADAAEARAAEGGLRLSLRDLTGAAAAFDQAQRLAEGEDDSFRARCLLKLGRIRLRQGELDGAEEAYGLACGVFEEQGEEHRLASALGARGELRIRAERFDEAREDLERSVAILERLGESAARAPMLTSLGALNARAGDYEAAAQIYERAAPLYRARWDLRGEAETFQRLGEVTLAQGRPAEAMESLREALETHAVAGDAQGMADDLVRLGRAASKAGQGPRGALFLESALTIRRRTGDLQGELVALIEQADVLTSFDSGTIPAFAGLGVAGDIAEQLGIEDAPKLKEQSLLVVKLTPKGSESSNKLSETLSKSPETIRLKGLRQILKEPTLAAAHFEDQLLVAESFEDVEMFVLALRSQLDALVATKDLSGAVAALMVAEEALEQTEGDNPRAQETVKDCRRKLEPLLDADLDARRAAIGDEPEEARAAAIEALAVAPVSQ